MASAKYTVPPASTTGTNETGMQTATNASIISKTAASINGANIGSPIGAWTYTFTSIP